ncbi:MAG: OprO/OprP family phosphate-selective porin [Prevotellaceae bacterium]|nr:OprO/OprP family phosphate-selective porin [Prevotellaceae bacterium]
MTDYDGELTPERIRRVFNWIRIAILLLLLLGGWAVCRAEEGEVTAKEDRSQYMPQLHGILRGKYEYEPPLDESRFEIRNARVSVEGRLPLRSSYKLEMDFCDETEIKMKDAWVGVNPWKTLQVTIGQQRLPFSIDAHRNPSAQYFANRSFIAKQTGDMRDVGLILEYTFNNKKGRKLATLDAGVFNGASVTSQKSAWHSDWDYSARLQLFPVKGLVIMPSVQHTAIADRGAHYTSVDLGAYYERKGWHWEAEWLRKMYTRSSFSACNAVDAMMIYRMPVKKQKCFLEAISYMGRYDYMGDHTDGTAGFSEEEPSRLLTTDYERHRMTLGVTLSVRNPYFPTDIRFNYEGYWYPHGGAKESEQSKIVAELAIRF